MFRVRDLMVNLLHAENAEQATQSCTNDTKVICNPPGCPGKSQRPGGPKKPARLGLLRAAMQRALAPG
ncbi:MAG TPA: hypothetical protein VH394_11095 [Thermoanaerobaculia bacterium]|jgi:hypothetical protein|nr:hypothetical protein [Thermoanaerobaculia bacterium]